MNVDEFISQHHHEEYCEAIILKDGTIEYALPGHIYKLIDITGEDMEELGLKVPTLANQVKWMVDYTNTIAIWYEFAFACENITDEQMSTLHKLQDAKVISNCFRVHQCHEMDRCIKLASGQMGKIRDHDLIII